MGVLKGNCDFSHCTYQLIHSDLLFVCLFQEVDHNHNVEAEKMDVCIKTLIVIVFLGGGLINP